MQPSKKKVAIMMAVSLGIITFAFLLPLVIIPAALGVSNASGCATSYGCSQDTFSKCGAYQSAGESPSFTDSMGRGMQGMLCMLGIDGGSAKFVLNSESSFPAATLNKIPLHTS